MIQTFPQGFEFSGKRSSQYTQVGDAVPPDLAFVVARAVYLQLNGGAEILQLMEPCLKVGSIQGELCL
jgi:DNA (cytosine-5)-methyltransferase 1